MNKKISWCLQQKNGIELVEPNNNLSEQYLTEAEETLQEITGSGSKWEVIMAYYACYHALYAILMRAGIKSEIHDCTLELLPLIKGFTPDDYSFLSTLKEQRIRAQYYLKKETIKDFLPVKRFVARCQTIARELHIDTLRGALNAKK